MCSLVMAGDFNLPVFHSNKKLNYKEERTVMNINKLFYLVTPPAQKIVGLWILWFQCNRFIDVFLWKIITNTHYILVTSKYNIHKSRWTFVEKRKGLSPQFLINQWNYSYKDIPNFFKTVSAEHRISAFYQLQKTKTSKQTKKKHPDLN